MKSLHLLPKVSEKAYGLSQKGTYVFAVPTSANKQVVASAVTAQFGVEVVSVNMANQKGKVKRTVKRGGRPTMGQRAASKKAYVTLAAGQNIAIFAAEDEADKKKATKAKTAKETK